MFCIGAPTSLQRRDELAASSAPGRAPSSACSARSSSASALQASATTRSAPNAAASGSRSEMTGPWRVARTVSATGGALRDPDLLLAHLERRRALRRQIAASDRTASTRSMNRSWVSAPVLVKPQAMVPLCPSTMAGMPGRVAPISSSPGVCEVGEVPYARRLQAEMRVVGEQGPAGERSSRTDHPGVRADPARLGRRQHRGQRVPRQRARQLDQGDRRALGVSRPDVGDLLCRQPPGQPGARELVPVVGREVERHQAQPDQAVGRPPRLELEVAKDQELWRQRAGAGLRGKR